MRFASYNIHGGVGMDRHFVPKRIAGVIKELDADVIALQEVESRATGFDMLAYLQNETGLDAIAGPTLVRGTAHYGNGLLTRCPCVHVKRVELSVAGREPRGALDVELICSSGPCRVIATHLGLRPSERRCQVQHLLGIFEGERSLPTVLMGDLNEWFLWGRPLRWLHRYFQHTPAPLSFPSPFPLLALDRIWVKPRSLLVRVAAHQSKLSRVASDHLPVIAVLDFGVCVPDPRDATVLTAS
jgi:endonuclease/exonuclease/phosphatase family metal-dependent hydrolase